MTNVDDFFSFQNTVNNNQNINKSDPFDYLIPIKAFARTTHKSIYVINYKKKGFEFVSDNPLFLCGHTAEEVSEMGYRFYLKYVVEEDLNLLLKVNRIGFDFYSHIPTEDRLNYYISYDFHIKNLDGTIILVNQKLTPLFLTESGKIWKAMCIISHSTNKDSGNIEIRKEGDNKFLKYDLERNYWFTSRIVQLNSREKEILHLSSRGFTMNEIAKRVIISSDTVKYHRKKLLEKLEVSNIAEAIAFSANNNLF